MDTSAFDRLSRSLGQTPTRRLVTVGVVGGLVRRYFSGGLEVTENAVAKKRHHKHKKGNKSKSKCQSAICGTRFQCGLHDTECGPVNCGACVNGECNTSTGMCIDAAPGCRERYCGTGNQYQCGPHHTDCGTVDCGNCPPDPNVPGQNIYCNLETGRCGG